MGTISSVRFLEGKRVGNWSAYLQLAHHNNSRPGVCQASQNYFVSLQQPVRSVLLSLVPILHLKKRRAVGRKFSQGDKGSKWRRREANSGYSWWQGSAHLRYHKGGDAYYHHKKGLPSIKPPEPPVEAEGT